MTIPPNVVSVSHQGANSHLFSYITAELIQDLCFLRLVLQKKGGGIVSFVNKMAEVKDKSPRLCRGGNEDVRG